MPDPQPFVLVCPQCRRKFRGDPAQPNAQYRCPDDRTQLVAEASLNETMDLATAKKMTMDLGGGDVTSSSAGSVPSQASQGPGRSLGAQSMAAESRRSVVASMQLGAATGRAGGMEANAEKYEVTGKLGQGGMGQVLKVMDKDLKREVAMKLLLAPGGRSIAPETLVRFVEEAQATGQLEHPNIVPVHDLGVDGEGRIYFTLKYVQGDSLKKVLKGRHDDLPVEAGNPAAGIYRGLYSPQRMINILIDICQGVAYAHAKGVIHRDLKPDNVMLGKFGEVLVMDWGLAKVVGHDDAHDHGERLVMTSRSEDESAQTMDGAVAGTPAYMAPEQARGEVQALDARTDIYSLGALLYEFLAGHAPYRGPNALAVVDMVKAGPPPALTKGGTGFEPIPRELKAICNKAMAREAGERYQSALELRDDLQAWLENREVSAAPDTALQKFGKWARRNRRMIAVSVTSALVVGGVAGGLWFGQRAKKIHDLLQDADYQRNTAKGVYEAGAAGAAPVKADDPYAAQKMRAGGGERIRLYRDGLATVIDDLRKVLELAPHHAAARAQLADANMELWRLALAENNAALMQTTRAEVERYAGADSRYADELNGWASLKLALSPPAAEAFLFSFVPFTGVDAAGGAQVPRLVPVPFSLKELKWDRARLLELQKREGAHEGLPPGAQSIFDLNPTPESRMGAGEITIGRLPPGSYLLLLRANGVEIRVPVALGRGEKWERGYTVPAAGAIPPGFVYLAGGGAAPVGAVNGNNAGAPPPHDMTVFDALIAREETTMGEYGEFLADLAKKSPAEAKKHYPHDFGPGNTIINLAELKNGALVPAQPDPSFLQSAVRGVTLEDARAYAVWRSAKDNLPYRLPKDWEWEIACRGADGRNFSWGNDPGVGFAVVTQGYGGQRGGMSWKWKDYKDESPWGVHNMAGGAAEWTGSQFNPGADAGDPVYGQYAIRGNAWALPPVGLMCNFRTSGQPGYFHPTIGFRLALDYPASPGVSTAEALAAPQNEHNHAGHEHHH